MLFTLFNYYTTAFRNMQSISHPKEESRKNNKMLSFNFPFKKHPNIQTD